MSIQTSALKMIHVFIEEKPSGLLTAQSPDLPGFYAAERTIDALNEVIPEIIRQLYEIHGQKVFVARIEDSASVSTDMPWVAMPAEIAHLAVQSFAEHG